MSKIKLPWRKVEDERPEIDRYCLVWECWDTAPGVQALIVSHGDHKLWWINDADEPTAATPKDRWIYLSEIANPFEDDANE